MEGVDMMSLDGAEGLAGVLLASGMGRQGAGSGVKY